MWQEEGGKRLDQLLKSRRIKSVTIARTLHVDESAVSRWRSGERVPSADELAEMLKMLDGQGLADYVLGLTVLNPIDVQRLRADVARLFAQVGAANSAIDPPKK